MNNIETELQRKSKDIHLSATDKLRIKNVVMEHTLEYAPKNKTMETAGEDAVGHLSSFVFPYGLRYAVVAILVVVVVGGGISRAAASALPGDALYAVKVDINEEVQELFTFTDGAKAQFNTERVGKRFEEAKSLISAGDVPEESIALVREYIVAHTEDSLGYVQEVAVLDKEGALILTADLGRVFEEGGTIVSQLLSTDSEDTTGISVLEAEIEQQQGVIENFQKDLERGAFTNDGEEDALVACQADAMVCPDGSSVGRIGPDCTFAKCPEGGVVDVSVNDVGQPIGKNDGSDNNTGSFDAVSYFTKIVQRRVVEKIGQPIEGFEPFMFMEVFPGLVVAHFDGVEASLGVYQEVDGKLIYKAIGPQLHSAARAITNDGMATLFKNVRVGFVGDITSERKVDELVNSLGHFDF